MKKYHPRTNAIRSGHSRTNEQEHSEPIFLSSSFVFDDAEQAAARFAKIDSGNVYSRFTNPTVRIFEARLASLEEAEACVATASGMSAIFATLMALLKSGDHLVASRSMFGSTIVLLNDIISRYEIAVSWVDLADLSGWEEAIQASTKLCLLETPSNPLGEVVDLPALAKITQRHKVLLVVDNVLLTPALQKPLTLGADIVVYSGTKYIDGQGRTLAGAILGGSEIIGQIVLFIRSTGPSLSAFNAWVCLKSLETLALRMQAHCDNAKQVARWLLQQSQVQKVYYLGLPSHPQHRLAKQQQMDFGGIVSFVLKGGQTAAFKLINQTQLLSITANLGDTKTTITHPATTTHSRLSDKEKAESGIEDGLVRLSIGLEYYQDIIDDLREALN